MSTEEISEAETRHVAHLARLSLTDEEVASFATQLSAVLTHAMDLAALSIDNVIPTRHGFSQKNVMRPDTIAPSLPRQEVLACAPDATDEMFVVPQILGEG